MKVTAHASTDPAPPLVPPLDLSRWFPPLGLAVELQLLPRLHQDAVALPGLHDVRLARLAVDGEADQV